MDRTKAMAESQIKNMINEFGTEAVIEGLLADTKALLRVVDVDNWKLISKLKEQKYLLEKLLKL